MPQDPVCGTEIDEAKADLVSVYRAELYYFCCPGCQAVFDENPAHYSEPTSVIEKAA